MSGADDALVSDRNGASDAKKARQDSDIETLTRENEDLKTRLDEAYAFIEKKNLVHGKELKGFLEDLSELTSTEAPAGIKTAMLSRGDGAGLQAYADSLYARVSDICGPMSDKTERFKKTGVTSDDMSSVVASALTNVKVIRDVHDQPRNLEIAYRLIKDLQQMSYGALEASYGDRPSDTLSDRLLVEIAEERRKRGEVWDYTAEMRYEQETSDHMKEYGIGTWYPKTIALFKSWQEEDEQAR